MPGKGTTRTYLEQEPVGRRTPAGVATIYDDGEGDRYVVSLIVGYADEDIGTSETTVPRIVEANMKEAAKAALDLTRDEGQSDTFWHVYDRKTKKGRFFEQGEFDDPNRD